MQRWVVVAEDTQGSPLIPRMLQRQFALRDARQSCCYRMLRHGRISFRVLFPTHCPARLLKKRRGAVKLRVKAMNARCARILPLIERVEGSWIDRKDMTLTVLVMMPEFVGRQIVIGLQTLPRPSLKQRGV